MKRTAVQGAVQEVPKCNGKEVDTLKALIVTATFKVVYTMIAAFVPRSDDAPEVLLCWRL